nr:hypothetical protein [Nanoarchaeum sp.]
MFSGIGLNIAPIFLFLFFFSTLSFLISKEKKFLKNFIVIIILFALIGAIRLIPLLNLLLSESTLGSSLSYGIKGFKSYELVDKETFDWDTLYKALFSPGPYLPDERELPNLPDGLNVSSVMYFGFIPVIFSIFGFILYFRKLKKYFILLILFISLTMGSNIPMNILKLLHKFPIYNAIYYPAKYYAFFVVLLISIAAGSIFLIVDRFQYKKTMIFFLIFFGLFAIFDMFAKNIVYFTSLSNIKEDIVTAERQKDFFQINFLEREDDKKLFKKYNPNLNIPSEESRRVEEIGQGMQYFLLKQNVGKVDWFGDLETEAKAIPKYYTSRYYGDYWVDINDRRPENGLFENPYYKGESYIEETGKKLAFTILNPDNFEITEKDILSSARIIINQNFDKYWKASIGSIENFNGLLSVKLNLPKSLMAQRVIIQLHYFPKDLLYGGLISFFSLIITFAHLLRKTKRLKKIGSYIDKQSF